MYNDLVDNLDLNELMADAARLDNPGNDFYANFVGFPKGDGYVRVRLLPPKKGHKFYCATRTHKVNGKNHHCPRELIIKDGKSFWADPDPKKPCPICCMVNDIWKEIRATNEPKDGPLHKQASAIRAQERYYFNCYARVHYNRDGEQEKNVGPKILSIGKQLFQRVMRALFGDDKTDEKPLGNIADLNNGRDFKIVKRMKPGDEYPEYTDSKFEDPSILGDPDLVAKVLSGLHDLSPLRRPAEFDVLKLELKRHLGLVPKEAAGEGSDFDINEFKKGSTTLASQVSTPAATTVSDDVNRLVNGDGGEDDSMSEADFVDALSKIPTN